MYIYIYILEAIKRPWVAEHLPDWKKIHLLSVRPTPLVIWGAQLRSPLNPSVNIVVILEGFKGGPQF